MSNTFGPIGFQYLGLADGFDPNFGLTPGLMAYNASACFAGDPLILSGGKLAVATATGNTGAAIAGIAVSFSWVSTSQGRRVWQKYYPGNDSVNNADVRVHFAGNPQALFEVQVASAAAGTAAGGPAAQADVGSFFNFATGAGGNTRSQLSSFCLDYSTKNAAKGVLPFYLYSVEQAPKTDPTSAGNLVRVGIATLSLSGGN